MDLNAVGTDLPPDDEPWVMVGGRQLVVSRSSGLHAPGQWVGVHTNALPREPISGEFRFDIALHATGYNGKPVRLLEQTKVTTGIPTVATHIFQSHLPKAAPAHYRLAVAVRGPDLDRHLRSYLTVPEQRLHASLTSTTVTARPGHQVPFRLANHGPTSILYGVDYVLERSTADGWRACNVEEVWVLIGLSLDPGEHADYIALLPGEASAGRYRVSKEVSGGGTNVRQTISFEFDVVS